MAYLGNSLSVQQYAPQVAYFSGNGSTTAFTLPVSVVSAAQIIVVVANVVQNPSSAYTVSGTTLTFTSAPPSGTNNIWVEYTSLQTNTVVPAYGTVGTSQLANGTVVTTADATINSLTVGKGGGSVSTNTAFGTSALTSNTSGANNQAFGSGALSSNTTGGTNSAFAQQSLGSNTTGNSNSAFGYQALVNNTTASNSTAVGYKAGYSATTAGASVYIGNQAGYSTNDPYNVMIGFNAGYSYNNNGSSGYCVLIGEYAGYSNTTGISNTFIGSGAGYYVTTGAKNTILGGFSGNQSGLDIRTASNYIVLSDGDGNPRVVVDNNGTFKIGASNNSMQIPSTGGTGYIGYITSTSALQIAYNSTSAGVQLGSGATSWGTFSDARLKNVTGTYTTALANIAELQPVKFTWKSDTENKPQVGVLAQSVQSVVPEAVESSTIEMNGTEEYLTVRYTELIPLMIASIQELNTLVTTQAAEIAALKAKVGV